jgi:hypothetical protein
VGRGPPEEAVGPLGEGGEFLCMREIFTLSE